MSKAIIEQYRRADGIVHFHAQIAFPVYSTLKEEQLSWVLTCCLGDWSFVPTAIFKGPGVLDLLRAFSVNSLERFDVGQAKHMISCDKHGKVLCEGMVFRTGEEEFRLSSVQANWMQYQAAKVKDPDSVRIEWFEPGTYCFFQVAGPNAVCLLEELVGESLRDIKFMRFRDVTIAGQTVRAVNGLTMAGETGFELGFPGEARQTLHDAIMSAGQKYGIRELGSRNHQVNHTLAMFPTFQYHYMSAMYADDPEMADFCADWAKTPAGQRRMKMPVITGSFEGEDISDYCHSPVELGWIKNINFDHEFLGRVALERELAGPKRKIVSLEYDSEDVTDIFASQFRDDEPFEFMNIPIQFKTETRHDRVLKDGKLVGVATHPAFSFYYQKSITLAYLDVDCLESGTKVEVIWGIPGKRQKAIRATVAPAPYKPDTRRMDLNTLPRSVDFSEVPDLKKAN